MKHICFIFEIYALYVTNMKHIFQKTKYFNQPLNNWNVSNVINMYSMFYKANSFNQPLNNWNMSKVKCINYMFVNAKEFDQPLNNWNWNVSGDCLLYLLVHGGCKPKDEETSDEDDSSDEEY